MTKRWHLGLVMIVAILLLLTACALPAPYPDWMLKKADPWIIGMQWMNREDLGKVCLPTSVACVNTSAGQIYLLDDPDPVFRDCVVRHERSHMYDRFVRQVSAAATQAHEGWIKVPCYTTRGVVE